MSDDMIDEKAESLAFKLVYEVAEKLKDEGLDKGTVWSLIFMAAQNQQAADLEGEQEELNELLSLQRDFIAEIH